VCVCVCVCVCIETGSNPVSQVALELMTCILQPPECWDYRFESPYLTEKQKRKNVLTALRFEPRAAHLLDRCLKHLNHSASPKKQIFISIKHQFIIFAA
jgi:hypothetical protein